ncbi:MAG: response regulator transcription factor [Bacteroidales bacterium]|nr:response regulator transcription factor [Bacteroidales bacterium]
MKIKLLIADDHQLFREGLVNLLADTPDIEIVGQAPNGQEALVMAAKLMPDIVIMDIGMPILNGIEATGQLRKSHPQIRVIALSMHSEKSYVKEMLEAGASGYLFKNCTYHQLIEGIQAVYAGKKYLSDTITEVLIHDYLDKSEDSRPTETESLLTGRETEVLKLFAMGKSTKEIADQLFVSIKTVGTHKQHIMDKLEFKSTTDLVKYAIRNKLIDLE